MAEYIYPAIFCKNEDETYTVTYPDLSGCITEGKSLGNAMVMAQYALSEWIQYIVDEKKTLVAPSDANDIAIKKNEFVSLVRVELKDSRAVKRTVSIPKWMDDKASSSGLSLSRVLQDTLKEKFDVI